MFRPLEAINWVKIIESWSFSQIKCEKQGIRIRSGFLLYMGQHVIVYHLKSEHLTFVLVYFNHFSCMPGQCKFHNICVLSHQLITCSTSELTMIIM